MRPEHTLKKSIKGLGWAKHKRNSDGGKNYQRKTRRVVKGEIKEIISG